MRISLLLNLVKSIAVTYTTYTSTSEVLVVTDTITTSESLATVVVDGTTFVEDLAVTEVVTTDVITSSVITDEPLATIVVDSTTFIEDLVLTTSVTTNEPVVTTTDVLDIVVVDSTTFVEVLAVTTTSEVQPVVTEAPDVVPVVQNFCQENGLGDSIANGTQSRNVTCSLTVFGVIPDFDHMVSTVIFEPQNGAILELGVNFTVSILSTNIEFGFFDDPNTEYYKAPQVLNESGNVKGHTHITIQKVEDPFLPPDVQRPVFFKGLNDRSLNGVLSTEIDGGLFIADGAGEYRICTITASSSHAALLMPVARRGSQDDCIRVNIV